ncbi:hypothetical protein ACHQM5_023755 [Ranunculus cassubicifolius]
MEMSSAAQTPTAENTVTPPTIKRRNWWLLLLYITLAAVGSIGGPLLQRLYFTHGGNRRWLSSFLLSVGFIVIAPLLSILYLKDVSTKKVNSNTFFMDTKLIFPSAYLGILMGIDNYMYSAGLSYIPVSTSSLLFSTQLAFTALFAFFIVKQKFTFYSFNSVVVLIFGTVVLAFHTSSDRPQGVSKEKYWLGFFLTLGGAVLFGLILPLIESAFSKSRKSLNYVMILQFQTMMNLFATLFCTVGMLINNDFKIIPREARNFDIGEKKYYMVLVGCAVMWQFVLLGVMGVIGCTSSLFAGILTSVLLPFTELAAIVVFQEKFTAEKGMSLALCLWGFISYFLGEYRKTRKTTPAVELNVLQSDRNRKTDLERPNHH